MRQFCRGQIPHVLQLMDYFEDSLFFYAVTEYIPTGDLHRYVLKNWVFSPLPEAIVKDILK